MRLKDVKKKLLEMNMHLQSRPDEKLINGYKQAMKDYEETGKEDYKIAGDLIKNEIERRGLKIE